MPIGQNLLVPTGAETSRDTLQRLGSGKGETLDAEGLAAFSSILAAQKPAELKALITQLNQAQDEAAVDTQDLLGFAEDGNSLPLEIKDWLQKLAALELPEQQGAPADSDAELDVPIDAKSADEVDVLAELSGQWQQWLSQLPRELSGTERTETAVSDASAAPGSNAAQADRILTPVAAAEKTTGTTGDKLLTPAQSAVSLPDMLAQLRTAMGGASSSQTEPATTDVEDSVIKGKNQPADADEKLLTATRQANGEASQPTQRVANLAASADSQGLFAAKLAEQKAADPAKPDSAALDALDANNKTASGATAAQGALTQRPVAAAAQTLAVPFGQTGWSESVVNKVMWMSSQNLKSVEIQLDPAELGPLEIKIQARGLEHQVQFVSQNPAVREALEGHMHRLRELFTQQGVDQLNVSVSGGDSGQQRGGEAAGGFAGGGDANDARGNGGPAGSSRTGSEDELPMAAAQHIAASSRLVDYYA